MIMIENQGKTNETKDRELLPGMLIRAWVADDKEFLQYGLDIDTSSDILLEIQENTEGFQASKNLGFTMTPLGRSNKFDREMYSCMDMLAVGRDRKTGNNISFKSHNFPVRLLAHDRQEFVQALEGRLAELKSRCDLNTIDAVLIGGQYAPGTSSQGRPAKEEFLETVKLISDIVKNILGFEPVFVDGPKIEFTDPDKFVFDNDNRRLYFSRDKAVKRTRDFNPSDVDNQIKKWNSRA